MVLMLKTYPSTFLVSKREWKGLESVTILWGDERQGVGILRANTM